MPKSEKRKFVKNKIGLFLVVVALNSIGYKLVQYLRPTGIIVNTWIDSFIPYISYFSVPYALYPVLGILPFVLYWKNYKEYRTMALSMITVFLISIFIYLTLQTQVIRENVEATDLFNWGTSVAYSLDSPVNAFPSLHVSIPTIATLFVYIKKKKLGLYIAPLTLLVILSTVFIKQHAAVDVLGGLVLAFSVFKFRHIFEK